MTGAPTFSSYLWFCYIALNYLDIYNFLLLLIYYCSVSSYLFVTCTIHQLNRFSLALTEDTNINIVLVEATP